jgi:3-oxoacyl-[acyl-carrier protein] reductase
MARGRIHAPPSPGIGKLPRGGGAIVNQSSTAAYEAGNYYKIAKTGVNAITIGIAKELGPLGIRINGIARPDGYAGEPDQRTRRAPAISAGELTPRRIGTTKDIVSTCLFLLSDEASWAAGQTWCVDGGTVLRI